jgi:hypothetical protein
MIKFSYGRITFYIFLLIVHIGLVWWLPYLPTQDGPSHIYNLVILHDLLNGGKEWGHFFTYQLRPIPNLGFIILTYPLLFFFTPLVVERIFISVYIVLLGVSVPFFLRTFEKPPFPISYFIFPLIFNYTLLMGFYSYIVAVPMFLLALSLAWRIRNSSPFCKLFCFNAMGFVIFYFHLIPFVFFILSLMVITMVESTSYKKKVNNLLTLLLIISPSILNFLYYFRLGTSRLLPDFSYLLSFPHYLQLLIELLFFSTVNFFPWQLFPASVFTLLIVFLAYYSGKDIYRRKVQSENLKSSEKVLLYLTLLLMIIYLFAPFGFGGGLYFNERLPWVILLIALPLLQMPEAAIFKRIISYAIMIIASTFLIFNAVILWQQNSKVEEFLSGLYMELPKGAFLMTYKPKDPQNTTVDILLHAASYYGIFKGYVDIGNYEASTDIFPVRFNKNMPPTPPERQISYKPTTINWVKYPAIQYLLGWEIDGKEKEGLNKYYRVIWEKNQFSMWQRRAE